MSDKVPPARVVRLVENVRSGLSRLSRRLVPPPIEMLELMLGTWVSQAIQVACALGVADALADGPLPAATLAQRVGADPDGVDRLMRALVSRGVFRRHRDGRYGLNALAETLQTDAAGSLRAAALFYGSRQQREHWTHLLDAVTTGKPVVESLRGKEFFEYLGDDHEFAELFNNAMTGISQMTVQPVVAGYDFSRYRTIVDVGGGHGRLLAAILAATPTARGVLYDMPDVVAEAPKLLAEFGLTERVDVEGGSFFESVPGGGDAYVLKHIIHDWADEQALAILRNVRAAIKPGATLLLLEFVIPDHDGDFIGKWVDLEMLLVAGGRERTAEQYRALLAEAGFSMTAVVETAAPISVVEARPV
ncbi:methyltransferase [Mycobacterium sp. EPa45]|uniref:methyltransferase n=1 Tax=Mycobacterium sp. EPa45 TaxID=1545728 RepID=UPI000642599C|nr:methyltransferase [Mycobacterium sp. EPa45]AKK27441.1 hydroxyneurosporene methyltransferase [Mycobacterium sp. EPa45]